jgi:threonine dehydratase
LLEIEKSVVEGAGATALAALLRHPERFRGQCVGLVLSGGNIDPLLLVDIVKRGMVRRGRLARVHVDLHDVPGALAAVTGIVAAAGANIEDIVHQRAFTTLPAKNAELDLVLHARGEEHVGEIVAALNAAGFRTKLHNH